MAKQKKIKENTTEQNSTPKQKRDIKSKLKSFLALVLVAVISIVGTWAYLNKKSNRIPNTFVGSKGLSLLLKEDKYNSTKTGKYSPGLTYDKDPVLYNTTVTETGDGDYYEWVAMRVDYIVNQNSNTDKNGNPTGLLPSVVSRDAIMGSNVNPNNGIIESINFDIDNASESYTGSWVRLDLSSGGTNPAYEIYVYKYPLKNDSTKTTYVDNTAGTYATAASSTDTTGSRTTPLFTQVELFDQDTLAAHGYADDKLPKFTISVLGGAIKVEDDINIDEFDITELTGTPTDAQTNTYNASVKIKNALVALLTTDTINNEINVNHTETGK